MQQLLPTGVQITVIHYTYATPMGHRIACMPNMQEFHKTKYHPCYMRSNDLRAVTCPACKRSNFYIEKQGAHNAAQAARR